MNNIIDKRKISDRRNQEHKLRYDRRVQADRRINNISAEWLPLDEITLHPTLRKALGLKKNKK